MHLIAYVSNFTNAIDNIDNVLNDIVITAKRNNAAIGVTGVLFCLEDRFLQIIEGEEEILRPLSEKIKRDPRHSDFEILIDTEVNERGFNDWHMDVIHLKAGKEYSGNYLKSVTWAFQNLMITKSDTLAEFYRSLLEEKKSARFNVWGFIKTLLPKRKACL